MRDDAALRPARLRVIRYFRDVWTGALPLSRVLWFDMLAVGTLINLVSLVATLMLFVAHVPTPVGVAAHLLPVPYNLILFAGVWQSSAREAPQMAFFARAIASVWLVAVVIT